MELKALIVMYREMWRASLLRSCADVLESKDDT